MPAPLRADLTLLRIPELTGWSVTFDPMDHPATHGTDVQSWQATLRDHAGCRRAVVDIAYPGGLAPYTAALSMIRRVRGEPCWELAMTRWAEFAAEAEFAGVVLTFAVNAPRHPGL
jgi:hypothetical protein